MPFDPKRYPPYWKQFSRWVRHERARNQCERCGVRNHAIVRRTDGETHYASGTAQLDTFEYSFREAQALVRDWNARGHAPSRWTVIVLTVAHLDAAGDICDCERRTGRKCAKPEHVLALCQCCHLAYDQVTHVENRRITLSNHPGGWAIGAKKCLTSHYFLPTEAKPICGRLTARPSKFHATEPAWNVKCQSCRARKDAAERRRPTESVAYLVGEQQPLFE